MRTIIFGWAVPVLGVQECSPLPLLWNATDFAWCLPPALGCWPTQPHNSSQVRETCGCQMCWVACDFCPYTVCLWARKPNLPNISQAFLDVKQPSQSSSISLSLDICKSAYFFCIQRVSPQSMHGWSDTSKKCMYFYLGKTISQGKWPIPALLLFLGCPLGSNLQLTSWCMH